MKSYTFIRLFFVILFFLIWSPKAFALAGFAESDSVLHYNNFADINWFHPGDGCSPYGPYCFYLMEKNIITRPFSGTLQQISIPLNSDSPFILMESMRDQWIIYDLGSQGIMFESDDFESALKKWEDLGFPRVAFTNATNLSRYFTETEESKAKNRMPMSELFWMLFGIIFYIHWKFWLIVGFIFLLILGNYIYERYSRRKHCKKFPRGIFKK